MNLAAGNSRTPFERLSPDVVVAAVEAAGERCDGRVLALGSYENRVYQVGREESDPVVVKFYRPRRWSDAAIREEHAFALELAAAEVPVVAPIVVQGRTLLEYEGFRYAVYPRRGGHWPELGSKDDRIWMGRFIGRLHAVGLARVFEQRPTLSVASHVVQARETVLASEFLPDYLVARYGDVTQELVERLMHSLEPHLAGSRLRIHGDCHRGNILWTDAGPHFVDLDDCMSGPAVQDLWMLLGGSREEMRTEAADLLEGYAQFAVFNAGELALIEPLRALRLVHYAAWLARRWDDPAFPLAFPWFAEPRYWEQHVAVLQEQIGALDEEPLSI
ncbi:MAG TPA: serine/threonine protein kinase [Steroidobacteraceae bacterium]|nr:serine/threonine protein kinase [Steroidobacteraceae bacterium]